MSALAHLSEADVAQVLDLCRLDLQSLYNVSQTSRQLNDAACRVQQLSALPSTVQLTVTRAQMGQLEILNPEVDGPASAHPQLLHQTQPWLITQDVGLIRWTLSQSRRIKALSLIDPNVSLVRQGAALSNQGADVIRSVCLVTSFTHLTDITVSVRVTNSQPYLCQMISKACKASMCLTLTGSATSRDQRALGKILSHLSWVQRLRKLKLNFDRLDVKTLVMVHMATKGKRLTHLWLLKRFTDAAHTRCNVADKLALILNSVWPGSLQHVSLGKHNGTPLSHVQLVHTIRPAALAALTDLVLHVNQRVRHSSDAGQARQLWSRLATLGPSLVDVHVERFIGSVCLSDFVLLVNEWLCLLCPARPEITLRNVCIQLQAHEPPIDALAANWPTLQCQLKGTQRAYWGITLNTANHHRLNVDFIVNLL